ncbi:hypothetical protein CKM354_000227100 [Cercospora kikuchii]|uniref:Heterokaryon incompatibility domain-containing protein n=1 Tax=Cercospora kikuchii TaxID=84275 RepID=A0A9P3CCI7_9PEZI|nr:uncharacterized protein CKM354_000227100 [Cercospora kikuchii]GIZ38872.1 hypothetical protein CKM354_000227100 [Cercospora kikuchii]
MRLLRADGDELVLETAYGESNKYAILSHRWLPEDEQEVRYADIVNRKDDLRSKPGWNKLEWCRQQASADGLLYFWADTACIDKSSSQELTESINSMYKWYKEAEVCYVYLQDMPDPEIEFDDHGLATGEADIADAIMTDESQPSATVFNPDHTPSIWDTWDHEAFKKCTWFTRAWTLQEMIAPRQVRFYSQSWRFICNLEDIVPEIVELTGVHEAIWKEGRHLSTFSVAQKMSWASTRTSTKVEDRAYSLLGLMGVNIPILYGEGTNSFQRLQDEILRTGSEDSIFAFNVAGETYDIGSFKTTSLLARSPEDFQGCGNVISDNEHVSQGFQAITNEVKFRQKTMSDTDGRFTRWWDTLSIPDYWSTRSMILRCGIENEPEMILVLQLRAVGHRRSDLYAADVTSGSRVQTWRIGIHEYDSSSYKTFSVLRDPTHHHLTRNERNERNDQTLNILCDSRCALNIELRRESIPGAWNEQRMCFVLLREDGILPEFDAELELSTPGSGEIISAHVELLPTQKGGILRMRFNKAMFLPNWTTLILLRDTHYCTFTCHNGGILVGRAFTFNRPLEKDNLLFLEFEHMPLRNVPLRACRRVGLCIAIFLLAVALLPIGIMLLPVLIGGVWPNTLVTRILLPLLVWCLITGILYHFDKMSLSILLSVPFGMLGVGDIAVLAFFVLMYVDDYILLFGPWDGNAPELQSTTELEWGGAESND